MYFVYILKSQKDGKYYYGSTSDLSKRLKSHNSGKVKSTKSRRPFVLHYCEAFDEKTDALKREQYFKSFSGHIWLKQNKIIE
jgi:putative endonuclease